MNNFTVEKQKKFSADNKKLTVDQQIFLDFSECTIKSYPKDKRDFKEIIEALKCFKSKELLETRDNHELTEKDKGTNSARITSFIDDYKHVWSIDVYHRNSSKGMYRLLYYSDFDDIRIAHVLDCFIDTH